MSGNPITDVLEHFRPRWEASDVIDRLGLDAGGYLLVTAHRQETVDVPHRLASLCAGLNGMAAEFARPIVWSVHPRTAAKLAAADLRLHDAIRLEEPFGFLDFVALQAAAACVVTDSGTVQEECSLLQVPAVTCRDTTERPETIECGSNVLCGVEDPGRMLACVAAAIDVRPRLGVAVRGRPRGRLAHRHVRMKRRGATAVIARARRESAAADGARRPARARSRPAAPAGRRRRGGARSRRRARPEHPERRSARSSRR